MAKPANREESTLKQTILACLEAPHLAGVSNKHFVEFKRLRELYEKQIQEKNAQSSNHFTPTSYKMSIEHSDLGTFIAAGWVEAAIIIELME